ncbi:MAG: hypothetical protein GEV05_10400 [Betaproteobacteria bacterium]|nr:hypothetical protein [Betaproteobacteria bacterium]
MKPRRRRKFSVEEALHAGGRSRIDLLRHCVQSVTMEPLFVFLVDEYRQRPQHAAALALFDMFCAPGAPARLGAHAVLPPMNLVLVAGTRALRAQWSQMQAAEPPAAEVAVPRTVPMRGLFDSVARAATQDPDGAWARLTRYYDPALAPSDNLPGGRMSTTQRHFVENVWKPVVRPRLVSAGFWQLQTIE